MVPAPTSNGSPNTSTPGVVDGKIFVTILEADTPLPARRIVELPFAKGAKGVQVAVWEGKEEIHVQPPHPTKTNGSKKMAVDSDDDEEDAEEEDLRTRVIKPATQISELLVHVQAVQAKDKILNTVRLSITVGKDRKVEIEAGQTGGEKAELQNIEL